ncbi:hypothetical protein F4819DRAFT_500756 [Hypoxylon fuscum]|nr:hypothetical protein F4819DRAFT_500756 [Hypoxylon fuscum]
MWAHFAIPLYLLITCCLADVGLTTNLTADSITNGTQLVDFVQDPNGRGTATLVLSCLLTLILCVWSALHLNVPMRHQSRKAGFRLCIRWILAGVYAPELVVFTAWRQWCSARLLQQIVEQILKDTQPSSQQSERLAQWTMAHSFFACTGGFAFEIEFLNRIVPNRPDMETSEPRRLTLTARGMAVLAKCGHLPSVRREDIEDKSKANSLAKATVIVQASWMLIQAIGRLASRLPVTPLEINTVAHVLCAFLIYLFWWNKPLFPNEPIILDAEELGPLAAFMYSSSEMSGYLYPRQDKSHTILKTLLVRFRMFSRVPEFETICLRQKFLGEGGEPSNPSTSTSVTPGYPGNVMEISQLTQTSESFFLKAPQNCLLDLQERHEKGHNTTFLERRPRIVIDQLGSRPPSTMDENRWLFIQRALQTFPMLYEDRISMSHLVGGTPCIHLKTEQLVADHVQNWPSNDLLRNIDGPIIGMVLWFANVCYGSIHAGGWNDHFPTVTELWLWRASAVYIGFCGGLWVVLNFLLARNPVLNKCCEHWMDGKTTTSWWQNLGLGVIIFLSIFGFVLARIFVVVEAAISIRELPASAYQTPDWINLFPHF